MSPNERSTVQVTLVLTPREFEAAMMIGEEALSILMNDGIIPCGETSSSDPAIQRDVAILGLQDLIGYWTVHQISQSSPGSIDDDDEIPF